MTAWDQNLANTALAIDQCIRMGGVVIAPPKKPTGFGGTK